MNAKDVIEYNSGMAQQVVQGYLGDLSDSDLMMRPVPGMNHIAWQLGHLINSEHEALGAVGARMPALPADFAARHTTEAASSDDPAKFYKKAEYLELMGKVRAAGLAALKGLPEHDLGNPGPEKMRDYCPTVGSVFALMMGPHELMHCGQWVAVRRKLGKPRVM